MSDIANIADLIRYALRHDEFQRAVLSGTMHGATHPWRRVVVRKVALRGTVQTQVEWHTSENSTTRNYAGIDTVIDELVEVPFRNGHVELRTATIEGRVSKRGKLLLSRRNEANNRDLAHDRVRRRAIPEDAPFLEVLGVSHDGAVKPTAQRKYRQINEFVRVLGATLGEKQDRDRPLQVLDLGCGNAYLTFATVHHLTESGVPCVVVGVDRDAELVARNNSRAEQLGWQDRLTFTTALIDRYEPTESPDLVVALHACDTATDDVLALAVEQNADYLLASPCCQHDLQRQLRSRAMPEGFRDLVRDGVLKEQLGDLLTDSLRASVLRLVGYQVDVFAFVPVEHTPRNNLIRAVRTPGPVDRDAEAAVRATTGMFGVRPRLAELLRHRLPEDLLDDGGPGSGGDGAPAID
ncbi:class I SAM-dependent methyltransferase [Micromonospora sp. NPDC004704]